MPSAEISAMRETARSPIAAYTCIDSTLAIADGL
jgi:hypothetical protein